MSVTPQVQEAIRTGNWTGWEKWSVEAQQMLLTELRALRQKAEIVIPETDDELKHFLQTVCHTTIPDTQVCEGHVTPFKAFSDAYFARYPVLVWKASRGFGGKSYLLALLGHSEALTLGAEVAILGGSGEQSLGVMKYLQDFTGGEQQNTQRRTIYSTGGDIRAQMASSTSVRGPHPQRLRLDEVDEMELEILDAAMGQPIGTSKVAKQTVMSSTHHYPDQTFTEVLKRANENQWPIYEWCYQESSAHPDGWLSVNEIISKQKEVTAAMWAAEYDLQEPSPEDRAILTEKVNECFRKDLTEWGRSIEFEWVGKLNERIEIEQPVVGATYATGCDWAKRKDFTIIDTLRTDVKPLRRVAWQRTGRLPWPTMISKFDNQVKRYPGPACHDATGLGDVVEDYQNVRAEPVVLTGQVRSDVFSQYIAAIENGSIISPKIRHCENEHRYCTNDDLRGAGHPPDSFVAGAMAYRAACKREAQEDEAFSFSFATY